MLSLASVLEIRISNFTNKVASGFQEGGGIKPFETRDGGNLFH